MALTETDDLEKKPFRSQPVVKNEALVWKLLTSIKNVNKEVFDQGFKVLGDMLLSERSANDEFERVKKERDR